jgi:hypothetical protein
MTSVSGQIDATPVGAEAPIVVDLGKHRRKAVKALRRGQGKLMSEVTNCIQELRAAGTLSVSAQPVVIIVREKRKRVAWPLG